MKAINCPPPFGRGSTVTTAKASGMTTVQLTTGSLSRDNFRSAISVGKHILAIHYQKRTPHFCYFAFVNDRAMRVP